MKDKISNNTSKLEKIRNQLIIDINQLDPNTPEITNLMMDISEKYGGTHGDIIRFIKKLNDNQNTLKSDSDELFVTVINELIETKKDMLGILNYLVEEDTKLKSKSTSKSSVPTFFQKITPTQIIALFIGVCMMGLVTFMFVHPEKSDSVLNTFNTIKPKGVLK